MNKNPYNGYGGQRMSTRRRFIIHYLNGNLRLMAKDGQSLPIAAKNKEDAVIQLLGAPADSWDGDYFTKWDGKLQACVEELKY